MMKPLPSGPWEALFPRAMLLIDEIERYGGASDPFWTLGGGTVLMFRYGHRVSKDIDAHFGDVTPNRLGVSQTACLGALDATPHRCRSPQILEARGLKRRHVERGDHQGPRGGSRGDVAVCRADGLALASRPGHQSRVGLRRIEMERQNAAREGW